MGGYSDAYSDLYDPAFPQSPLDVRPELLLGSTWTDLTPYLYQRNPVNITRGRPDEASSLNPSSASLTVNNRDGRFTANNPLGAWNGLIGRNVPLRLSVPNAMTGGGTYLRIEDDATSYVSCYDRAGLHITGNIDIRLEMQPTNYGLTVLAGKWNPGVSQAWLFELVDDGTLKFFWSATGTSSSGGGTSSASIGLGRIAVRVTFAVATGTLTFYTAPHISGPWTQLGISFSATGGAATSIFAATAPIQLGYFTGTTASGYNGNLFAFQLYNGIGGTLVASPDFTAQVPGAASFADAQGNLWSMAGSAELSGRSYRFHGELSEAPKASDPSATDVYSDLVVAGVLRRLQRAQKPLNSAMYRAYVRQTGVLAPVAYWPCEDAAAATQIASGLPAGTPMSISGTPSLSSSSAFVCSASLPSLSGARLTGTVATATAWSANAVRFLLQIPSGGEANGAVVARVYTNGTVARLDLIYASASSGQLSMNGYSGAGTLLFTVPNFQYGPSGTTAVNGALARVEMWLQPSGGNVQSSAGGLLVGQSGFVETIQSTAGKLGAVTSVVVNPNGTLTGSVVGHISVQTSLGNLLDMQNPLGAWAAEAAGSRVARLCAEEGVRVRIQGHPLLSAPMGTQGIKTLANLLQECEDADRGLLGEPRQCVGVGYRTFSSLCNQQAVATASYTGAALAPPFAGTGDDQYTVNDLTVSNAGGSSARAVASSGPMSVQNPPNGIGLVDTSLSVNVAADTQLSNIAGWVVHTRTDYHDRFPTLAFNMARAQTPVAVAVLDIGDKLAITRPPGWLQPDEIDQLGTGFTESLGPLGVWQINVNAVPAYPYTVGVYDDATFGHYDTDGSTLQSNINATAATFLVATGGAASQLWTTVAGDFPFDIVVSANGAVGERMTVTNITGSSSPQTFTVTRSVNGVVRAWAPGADVRLFQPAIYSL